MAKKTTLVDDVKHAVTHIAVPAASGLAKRAVAAVEDFVETEKKAARKFGKQVKSVADAATQAVTGRVKSTAAKAQTVTSRAKSTLKRAPAKLAAKVKAPLKATRALAKKAVPGKTAAPKTAKAPKRTAKPAAPPAKRGR